jgi:hypothetical protein
MKRGITSIALICLFLILSSLTAFALTILPDCTTPESGMIITSDTEFCEGTFDLHEAIVIEENNVAVRGKSTVLRGDELATGILVTDQKGVIISDLHLSAFATAIKAERAELISIVENKIWNNTLGIHLRNVNDVTQTNIFENNTENVKQAYACVSDGFCPKECGDDDIDCRLLPPDKKEEKRSKEEKKGKEALKVPEVEEVKEEIIKQDPFSAVTITEEEHEASKGAVDIQKRKDFINGKTVYTITLTAKKNMKALHVEEFIPKHVAQTASAVESRKGEWYTVKEDPVKGLDLAEVRKGESIVLMYAIDGEVGSLEGIETKTLARITLKQKDGFVRAMLALFGVMYAYFYFFLRKRIRQRHVKGKLVRKGVWMLEHAYTVFNISMLMYLVYAPFLEPVLLPSINLLGPRVLSALLNLAVLFLIIKMRGIVRSGHHLP